MILGRPMVGIAVYHSVNLRQNTPRIAAIVSAVNLAIGDDVMRFARGQFADSDRFSRPKRVDTDYLRLLEADLQQGRFRELQFDELPGAKQESSLGFASLRFQLAPSGSPRPSAEEVPELPYRLHLLVPLDCVRDADVAERCIGSISREVASDYAFVCIGSSFRDVLMDVTAIPMFHWGEALSAADERRRERIHRCQEERVRVGSVTCGAFWGNVLSARIVRDLGGLDRIRREAPVAVVRELEAGRCYLQATAWLPLPDDPRYESALKALDAYLEPVSATRRGDAQ